MDPPAIPDNEEDRLAELLGFHILDTPAEEAFDRVTRMLCAIFEMPIATVTLVDRDRQWFKSARGIDDCETAREISFCGHVVSSGQPLIVEETLHDPRFQDNPLVTAPPQIRFYAGVPLTSSRGFHIGVLTVQDRRPRTFSARDLEILTDLSHATVDELELRRTQCRLERERNLFVAGPTVVFLWDRAPGCPIRYVSANVAQVLGYTVEQLAGGAQRYIDLIHPDDLERTEQELEHHTAQHDHHYEHAPYRLRRADGAYIWVHDFSIILRDDHGEVEAYHGYIVDITGRIEAEIARQSAEEERNLFFAGVSHDLRTPLNAILGFTDLLARSPLDETQHGYIDLCRTASYRLLGLVDTLLDLSRLEAGRLDLQREPFALRTFLSEQIELMRLPAEEKGLRLEVELDDALPDRVVGDPTRFAQVLFNLGINAIKFTTDGSVTIAVRARQPNGVEVAVTDTGPGIPPAASSQIFEPFQQLGDKSAQHRGSGLGLAISRKLVHLMGGSLWLESELGVGSTFYFTAELIADDLPSSTASTAALEADSDSALQPEGVGQGLHVLVAEDEPTNALLIRTLLEQLGADVVVVEDGEQALATWQAEVPDLVLLDIQMPKRDGLNVLAAMRQEENELQRKSTPIAMLTAHALDAYRDDCMEAGADAYLTKPLCRHTLSQLLSSVSRAQRAPSSPA